MTATETLLARIRGENLGVYRESPKRLREDVSQEAEIAHDYRGRLVYELLQNADDAMLGQDDDDDRVVFLLTPTDLWVGNTGRPLDDGDVEGLCGTGISTKTQTDGPKRASIGHKGMGFKSVLEVTDRPSAYSMGHSFRMSAEDALAPVTAVLEGRGQAAPGRVPAMRFPWPVSDDPAEWRDLRAEGIRTLFRFPLRDDLTVDQRRILGDRLRHLPITSLVFLKHLERVDIRVQDELGEHSTSLRIEREQQLAGVWAPVLGLADDGTFRITVSSAGEGSWTFLLAHDGQVSIAGHRGGLDPFAWEGIELTEVAVATPWPIGGAEPPGPWRRFHVFLPTMEELPHPLLVNGAFATDLSRQEIRIGPESDDYNHHLVERAAAVIRDRLLPAVLAEATPEAVIAMLDRSDGVLSTPIAAVFQEALREAIADVAFVPTAGGGRLLAVRELLVPPPNLTGTQGSEYRTLLPDGASFGQTRLPAAPFCDATVGHVLVDLGARALTAAEAVSLLADAEPAASQLQSHGSAAIWIDPVLTAIERLWRASSDEDRERVADAARGAPLFPVSVRADGSIDRIATNDRECFYPPRSFTGGVPLDRLSFLAPEVCWGELAPKERNEVLRDQLPVWQALYQIREFRFPAVMQASVLPALDLEQGAETVAWRRRLETVDRLAAICQLAGRTPKPNSPLPYQRLGSDRALFNLARLSVPVRPGADGEQRWAPAFRVYFGQDWIGSSSVEMIFDALRGAEPDAVLPEIEYLASPELFRGRLARYRALEGAADDSANVVDEDEVSIDEDEDLAIETDELDRWRTFLGWLGVNRPLRPIHFHDVEEQRGGWLRTRGLSKPEGAAFADVGDKVWAKYRAWVAEAIGRLGATDHKAYFFELFELEHAKLLIDAASRDAEARVAEALFLHLAHNWGYLEQFSKLRLALIPADRDPGWRTKPIRPWGDVMTDETVVISAVGEDPDDESPAHIRERAAERGRIPLWLPEDLSVSGTHVVVWGTPGIGDHAATNGQEGDAGGAGGWSGSPGSGYGSQATDLTELNRVGMSVAMAYEVNRVRAELPTAAAFDSKARSDGSEPMVFDVSTPDAARIAIAACPGLASAFDELASSGVDTKWPGFDILTLDPGSRGIGRLIELKSSGVNATIQTMSWNEWKSARDSGLRGSFWLYLVGNLRSDLADARPFVRAIQDPFGTLLSTIVTEPVRRAVQLDVRRFERAEFIELDVTQRSAVARD